MIFVKVKMEGNRRILIVSFPFQGSVIPCMRFTIRLIKMGVYVTFCTSISAIQRLKKESTPHGLTFAPFSDSHDSGMQPPTTLQQYGSDVAKYGAKAVTELIRSVAAAGQPFDHMVYTVPWAARVAYTHGIQSTFLWLQSAISLNIYYNYYNEYHSLFIPSNPTFNFPGLPPLTAGDLPSFLVPANIKEDDYMILTMKDHIDLLKIYPRILVNSFYELEVESIGAINQLEFLPIGPLIPDSSEFLDKRDNDYMEWLNTKPRSSVVYVSFGTIVNLSMDQLEEVAIGLLESRRPFLWVIRDGEEAGRLTKIEELNNNGMIVRWCAQVVVLSHEAIGCFVTHGGWNSTLETLVAGVPTVLFPQWSDQGTNAKMMEDVWRIGVRVVKREGDGMVKGKEIERCVEMVMGDEDMKKNAEKWRELATEALNDGGSSTINLLAFLDEV